MATIQELQGRIGEEIGVSDWILIDQERVNRFADATDDHQFIHVDPEAAKLTPFGGTIAHGFLTLSLIAGMQATTPALTVDDAKMGVNYGGNKVRFLSPVAVGKRVRGRFKLLDIVEKAPGQWQLTQEITIEIEGQQRPALLAEWIAQVFV